MAALDDTTRRAYERLAAWLAERHRTGLKLAGINGAQGSGKSTLAAFLVEHLAQRHGLDAVTVSLDDFYLDRAARAHLAATVHPLLATRGPPGTHDVARGRDCLERLRRGQRCALPRFSKATDKPLGPEHDRQVTAAPALVLFEGWCVGTPPQPDAALAAPVNELERLEDASGAWRCHVNAQLAGPYAAWFGLLEALVFLRIPGWAKVKEWRGQQERETAAANGGRSLLVDEAAHERFLRHYERLTHHALAVLPARADAVLELDDRHAVAGLRLR